MATSTSMSPTPTPSRGTPTPSARNPISLRLYKALSSSFQDESSREALETLSAFYAPPPLAQTLSVNLNGATASSIHAAAAVTRDDNGDDSSDEEDAPAAKLDLNARWYERNLVGGDISIAEKARKEMRRDIEKQLAESSVQFLKAFGEVDKRLDVLQEHVDDMRTRCEEAQLKLEQTNESCKYLLDKASGLRSQRQTTATRQTIISLFLSRFTLTEAESEAITSPDVPVGKRLFAAMDRAEAIRQDCHLLLSGDDGQSTAGLDIMAKTASQLDQAYDKVQKWCSFEFRQLGKDSHLEVSPTMRDAVQRLLQRPEIATTALSTLFQIRQATLLSAFTTALTRGGPSGLPRPIELHAHDPIRYVGDMLAWVHQTMASEREFLDALFGTGRGDRMVGSAWVDGMNETSEGEGVKAIEREMDAKEWVRELMDRNLEKICTPLRVRVQQTIKSQEGSITAYKITNLLQFYHLTMKRTIGADALLSQTLKAMIDVSNQVFFDAIEAQGRSLLRSIQPPEADLSPPLSLRDVCQILKEILSVYTSSLLDDEESTPQKPKEAVEDADFNRILDAVVDPALEMCRRMIDLKKDRSVWEREIFLVNCTVYVQNVLQAYPLAAGRLARLDNELDGHLQLMVDDHYKVLLADSGLAPLISALEGKDANTPLSRLPEASSAAISGSLSQFDAFLSSLDVLTSPRLGLVSSPRLSSRVYRSALHKIGEAYGRVADAIRDPANRVEFASTVLGSKRPFGQMSVLWQVLGSDA